MKFLLLIVLSSAWAGADEVQRLDADSREQNVFSTEAQNNFTGRTIHQIEVKGLKRTRLSAVRGLLAQHEGDSFDPQQWAKGIHKLYDTTVLFDIRTKITPTDTGQVDIEIQLYDRWTLLPYGIAQAGGGSADFGGGLFEANFLGYFGQLSAGFNSFNNVIAYDVNYFQEFIGSTDFMFLADVSGVGNPVNLQKDNGDSIGNFTWYRQQEQLMLGHRFEPNIRLFSYLEFYEDHMVTNTGAPEVRVYRGLQYRLRPTIIFGRSELTNFLEEGFEWAISPTSANFFNTKHEYSSLVSTFKKVWVRGNTNFALFVNAGAMTKSPIPYLFRLGGYDTVRGFSTNRAVGRYYIDNSLEYRPYLTRFMLPIIGETVLQGDLFQDFASMWNSDDLAETRRVNSQLTLLSQGVGIRFNFLRFSGAIARIDVARTMTPNEGWGAGFGVGQFF